MKILCTFLLGVTMLSSLAEPARPAPKRTCLVLADGTVSEYAWGHYQESQFPWNHPGHDYCIRGLLETGTRFHRWLPGWNVRRVDLEKQQGPLRLEGVDLVILDDVRQSVCDPHEPALVEFVRQGGGLLVYGGFWGLGGCAKTEYNAAAPVSSFQRTPLGGILPVEIVATPDYELLRAKPAPARRPAFLDPALGQGIAAPAWEVLALHACKPRGEVLAQVDGRPLVCRQSVGKGRVVVYAGDDLGWVRAGTGSNLNAFAGTLWRRLAALAVGDTAAIPARPDPEPVLERGPAFAHPDQPMNFLWGGAFYYRTPEMERLWARDLLTHSATLFSGLPESVAKAGVQSWEAFGPPLFTKASVEDPETWAVDAQGKPIKGQPCFNNPKALANMEEAVGKRAAELAGSPWVTYGHMGDETEYGNCFCPHCRRAGGWSDGVMESWSSGSGTAALGDPSLHHSITPSLQPRLDAWIDYHLFKNASIGRMYARAGQAAKAKNPRLRMFASLPQAGGMCHGDDLFHTQSGFDLLWDHTYPGTMAIRVGLNAALMEETAALQGRPDVPILDLLQGFDSYDRASHMPPPEYMREMAWQAIAHGVDSVGWFVYNYCFWNLPGSEAWEGAGRLAHEVLEPLTPTLFEMRNAPQPVGLLTCYSQEAVDGLKEQVWDAKRPWKGVIRWWSTHATQEAYEVLKYAGVPFNVVSEHRLFEGKPLPWKALVIPYVEHLHAKSRAALAAFQAAGGTVYVGANSTLDLPGARRLPVAFDTKFTTWWPEDRTDEWNQRRVRAYMIGPFLEKAAHLRRLFAPLRDEALATVDDPEVITSVRRAGAAQYLFLVNDHQVNPVSPELRQRRRKYNHFMLMPMEFPKAGTTAHIRGGGYLYPLLSRAGEPTRLAKDARTPVRVNLAGGDGKVFLILPEPIRKVEMPAAPARRPGGIAIQGRVLGESGVLKAALPLRVELRRGTVRQTAYAATRDGALRWTVPFLKAFPAGPVTVVVTDLASGKRAEGVAR